MSEQPRPPSTASNQENGESGVAAWPQARELATPSDGAENFLLLRQAATQIPSLHLPAGRPLIRDRWERLVTAIEIPAPLSEVWQALISPADLKQWLAVCHGSLADLHKDCVLDFEDGEFFLCRTTSVTPKARLQYFWRWLGIGQATLVTWQLESIGDLTRVTVTEEATNPPWDWQTWNGGGWPGILDQLAAYLRTGLEWRWPWRRMGPYAQIEVALPLYEAWDRLITPQALKYWLLSMHGSLVQGEVLPVFLGDASGMVNMVVREVIQPGQSSPSFLPHIAFSLKRQIWNTEVGGRLWLEPAGWGRSLFQVFHFNWENLPPDLQLSERRLLTTFWAGAMRRAAQMCGGAQLSGTPHNWS